MGVEEEVPHAGSLLGQPEAPLGFALCPAPWASKRRAALLSRSSMARLASPIASGSLARASAGKP